MKHCFLTLFCHESASLRRYGRDIKTVERDRFFINFFVCEFVGPLPPSPPTDLVAYLVSPCLFIWQFGLSSASLPPPPPPTCAIGYLGISSKYLRILRRSVLSIWISQYLASVYLDGRPPGVDPPLRSWSRISVSLYLRIFRAHKSGREPPSLPVYADK